jgi:hypothetical protein
MIKDNDEKLLGDGRQRRQGSTQAQRGCLPQVGQPVYAKAREKYGADVDAVLADAAAMRKAVK